METAAILQSGQKSVTVEKSVPLQFELAYLASFDNAPVDEYSIKYYFFKKININLISDLFLFISDCQQIKIN